MKFLFILAVLVFTLASTFLGEEKAATPTPTVPENFRLELRDRERAADRADSPARSRTPALSGLTGI